MCVCVFCQVSRYVKWVNIFTQALGHSASALLTVLYIIMVMVLVLSAVMFYLENDHWDPTCGGQNHDDFGVNGCYVTADGQRSKCVSVRVCGWFRCCARLRATHSIKDRAKEKQMHRCAYVIYLLRYRYVRA